MQTSINDNLVDSLILKDNNEKEKVASKALTDLNSGTIDKIIISRFQKNEIIVLKGLKFQIKHIDNKRKKMTLKML